jgi:hypothetical protein
MTGAFVDDPRLAATGDGAMTAVWRRSTATDEAIVAARFAAAAAPAPPAPAADTQEPPAVPATRAWIFGPRRCPTGAPAGHARRGCARDRRTAGVAQLRFIVPRRLARTLDVGQRVRLTLRLRARPAKSACPYGKTRTLQLRTRLARV